MTSFTPTSSAEVLELVQWSVGEEQPLEIVGHGSRRGVGQPAQTEHTLDLSKLSGVTLYEPEELVISARAGTPLAEIETMLAARGQELAFEPIDHGPLAGQPGGGGTIGGVLASNASGPRRIRAGAARDHILGVHCVSGRGEAFKSGGRVVKNVTGYDLSKAMAGSWGTLAVVTDLTFKVLPAAETQTTLVLRGLSEEAAAAAMAVAMGSSAEVSGAGHLPETVTGKVLGGALSGRPSTLFRIEGFGPSVEDRAASLGAVLAQFAPAERLAVGESRALWREMRDCRPFADGTQKPVWRVSTAPASAHRFVMALRMELAADAFYDWQGGLVWLRLEADPEPETVRRALAAHGGGHATLVRAPAPIRAASAVFQPQPPALAALSRRLKAEFDPNAILNPGRMGF